MARRYRITAQTAKALADIADEIGVPSSKGPKFGRGGIGTSERMKRLLARLRLKNDRLEKKI